VADDRLRRWRAQFVRALPLLTSLSDAQQAIVNRFIQTTQDLASSTLLNSSAALTVRSGKGGKYESHQVALVARDAEVGFTALLRQCDRSEESASFSKVMTILQAACDVASDEGAARRAERLKEWGRVIKRLHRKSPDQLVRDRLVRDEGLQAFAYDEPHTPKWLIEIYNYGDNIHWAEHRGTAVPAKRPMRAICSDTSFTRWPSPLRTPI